MSTFSSSFLANILENFPFFVAVKDAVTRRYVLVNPAFCALMGRSSDEIKGKRDEELIGEQRAAERGGLEDRVITDGRPMAVPEILFGGGPAARTLSLS